MGGFCTEQKIKGILKLTRRNLLKLPKQTDRGTVSVGSHTVAIHGADMTKAGCFGCALDTPEPEIWIDTEATPDQQARALVHELFEVTNNVYDLGMTETTIRILEQSVCQAFKGTILQ